jgi:hypothetical protein
MNGFERLLRTLVDAGRKLDQMGSIAAEIGRALISTSNGLGHILGDKYDSRSEESERDADGYSDGDGSPALQDRVGNNPKPTEVANNNANHRGSRKRSNNAKRILDQEKVKKNSNK